MPCPLIAMNDQHDNGKLLSVAPMMAWTDRHCRYLHRLCAARPVLFTEMITAGALCFGAAERLLKFSDAEHPLAIQLGGSDPGQMAEAARRAADGGYDEININVGCPSPRVRRGAFGACLMREPALVARMVKAMRKACDRPVTVKCRLGVDDHDSQPLLEAFVGRIADAGCERFYVHARKALLNGLSPAENRQIPPLCYERIYALKTRYPELTIILNGGITDIRAALEHLQAVDGLMIGRQAYRQPLFMNALAHALHGEAPKDAFQIMADYMEYMDRELAAGTRLADMTRHCLGLFTGMPGARHFRRLLSDHRRLKANDISLVAQAMEQVRQRAA